MVKYLRYLIQLIVSPGEGWKDIAADKNLVGNKVAFSGLLPWLVVVALTSFVPLLYNHFTSFSDCLLDGLVNFGKFILTYFFAPLVMSAFIDSAAGTAVDDERLHILTAFSIGLLGVVAVLENCMPVRMTILHFLPFFVGIIIWKGTGYLGVSQQHTGSFMILALLCILAPPYLIGWLLGLIF